MVLVSNRFSEPLDYASYFDEVDVSKTWKALYAYRSVIVHGDVPDFALNELKSLKSDGNVAEFVKEAVRRILMLALDEPALVRDLLAC